MITASSLYERIPSIKKRILRAITFRHATLRGGDFVTDS